MPARRTGHRFRFVVLGRYPAHLKDNATAVTLNMSAGDPQGHLVHCGTLTMAEAEWDSLREALRKSIGDRLEVEDLAPQP
ncbi:MAG: hypothetical protein M3135_09145 [Actinomycetota bacterium]|nr:hypothetical protein [Actinomycetota bacterium]